MTETEAEKLDLAVECFKSGLSLVDSAKRYGLTLTSLEAEVERRAKAKRSELQTNSKSDFLYESAQMEDAVNSVLCGMSIKEAAHAYGVSKISLKQALQQELEKEPTEEGAITVDDANSENDSESCPGLPEPIEYPNVLVIEPEASEPRSSPVNSHFGLSKLLSMTPKEDLGDEIPVHCGEVKGSLARKHFLCPGLRSECILLPGGRWVTPKSFSILGGKASLKNWKNAVRVRNISLRHYMDAGYIDFFEHETNCSGKCSHKSSGVLGKYQSRINSMRMKTAQDIITQEELRSKISPLTALTTHLQSKIAANSASLSGGTLTSAAKGGGTNTSASSATSLLPFMQNVTSSPAFTVLRQAQSGEVTSLENQPVFPGPAPLAGGQARAKRSDSDIAVTGVTPPIRKMTSILPTSLSQHLGKIVSSGNVVVSSSFSPQTIVVRPVGFNEANKKVTTYLVPTNLQGANAPTLRIPNNTVMIPVRSSSALQTTRAALSKDTSATSTSTTTVPSTLPTSFPTIDNIIRDSSHFWKGIVDIGLLDSIVHDMKLFLSLIKRRAYSGFLQEKDAKALSKIATVLGLQETIRVKLSQKKDEMECQNNIIQYKINELKREMEEHERRQQELKRKSEMFDELMAKRPCVQLDSSDDEEADAAAWSVAAAAEKGTNQNAQGAEEGSAAKVVNGDVVKSTDKTVLLEETGAKAMVNGQINVVNNSAVGMSAKQGRSSRKSAAPMKMSVVPNIADTMEEDDSENELCDMDTDKPESISHDDETSQNGLANEDSLDEENKWDGDSVNDTNGIPTDKDSSIRGEENNLESGDKGDVDMEDEEQEEEDFEKDNENDEDYSPVGGTRRRSSSGPRRGRRKSSGSNVASRKTRASLK